MKRIGYKSLFVIILGWISLLANAQRPVGSWQEYRAYQNSSLVAETPHHIFSVYSGMPYLPGTNKGKEYDGSLMSYSKADGEVKCWTKADGLNDFDIRHLGYNKNTKTLVLVYANANIDIITEDGTIYNISDLKDDDAIQEVNNLEFEENYAYISTNINVAVLNLAKIEIKEQYRLGQVCYSCCIYNTYAYIATESGVFRAPLPLTPVSDWSLYAFGNLKDIRKLAIFSDWLVFYQFDNSVYYQDDQLQIHSLNTGSIRQLSLLNNQLVLVRNSDIWFYTNWNNRTTVQATAWGIDAEGTSNEYWLASGTEGLKKIKKDDSPAGYSILVDGIEINSPKRNINFHMIYQHDKLWVVGGNRWTNRNEYPGTLMIYDSNRNWHNTDEDAITKETGLVCRDFTSIAVDPSDDTHYFVSSWGEGVYEFQNNQFVTLHNKSNSVLQSTLPDDNPIYANYVRTSALHFDNTGNLYVLSDEVENAISIYNIVQKQWSQLNTPMLYTVDQLLFTRTQKWANFVRAKKGLFVWEDNGSPTTIYQSVFSQSFTDQDGEPLSINNFYAPVEDQQESIWIGTDIGPLVFNKTNQDLRNDLNTCVRPKMPRNDGTNNADYLLDKQTVISIVVDGGNRKWLGTRGAGLFLATPNGDKVLANYSTENSQLISDNINCMAMNQETGELFIGTDKGLVSFMTDAIEGKSDYSNVYAYPNPVRPEYRGEIVVTGLIADSHVKITDINGNLIVEGTSVGGQFSWNGNNNYGEPVKTGIYLVLSSITQDINTQGVVTKIMVIR